MNHVAAIAIGVGSALLIGPLILFELGGDKTRGRSKEESTIRIRSQGIPIGAAVFVVGAAALIGLFGILSGHFIFAFVGIFVSSCSLYLFQAEYLRLAIGLSK